MSARPVNGHLGEPPSFREFLDAGCDLSAVDGLEVIEQPIAQASRLPV